ncbi:MAG: ABC transporter ATP-binding protein [Pontibacterium sp.]
MSHTFLSLSDATLAFRIYGAESLSLKKKLINIGTGGRLSKEDDSNNVVVNALNNISINLKQGDRLGIVGGNGAGKSTLLRVLAGIYKPQSGTLKSNGEIAAIIDPAIALDPFATGRENVHSRAVLLGIDKSEYQNFLERVATISELGDYLEMPVHNYSSGMMMRLNFALSIAVQPDILLLDEWLSVTDLSFTSKAEAQMQQLVDNSRILVLASHSLDLLERVCNVGIWLDQGTVRHQGAICDTIAAYKNHVHDGA